ncbi:hypothetical protein COW36_08890 [bacterium (Candidatus Blackallbacteria) CG17_big_fil_post_rev_8_21_14_2_50_48_46]|uniref:Porin n=1 Tax=bacterium (Candidatus Blackallbacteria) CG17_big_fil_post_rev_8_21_14_2_50_48_46 TaxID=2014261 RepID=A0A2M7G6G2_9BACT|nr:MAG: hypothetical protein COW64_06190 [bacterium (Candidatus Blackallbacteria) CG18_big_fil_WC_8_21_14_2_50_49_26]PIW17601.1 MAG: hypothetical protein COW36_08890 [bacterium (Candidatus Blackallbacteria) CG17_big_fil_post_rev_8_21_14_2_50_48_46]PIW48456.1 MAG: hypothetical protein COW20_10240 [bacterium (Candidatus Blackallbacteria) CG13_big_fil_rev_8_21_14_2_50_49_14]
MRFKNLAASLLFLFSTTQAVLAQEVAQAPPTDQFFDMDIESLLNIDVSKLDKKFVIYGYVNANLEEVFNIPRIGANGQTESESDPYEFSIPNFHIYGKANLFDNIDILINLAKSGNGLEIRNAWGNFKLYQDLFQVRFGKMYQKFGLYNEKLDQIPVILGIEPPELFDQDHLLLPRTTSLMLHGENTINNWGYAYALATDNGEGGASLNTLPLSWDLRGKVNLDFAPLSNPSIILGTSGFVSSITGGKGTSTVGLGNGSPRGGILPWMSGDNYMVFGGFLESQIFENLNIQAAYWHAVHNGERNPESVLNIVRNGGLLPSQRQRFLGSNSSKSNDALSASDVITQANYQVQTFYLRAGYSIPTDFGTFTPYAFLDWMSHPEVIGSKTYGGDNEAGMSDDGVFFKPSLGVVYRPTQNVALKVDSSMHIQKFNGATTMYPEVRFDASFAFSTQ